MIVRITRSGGLAGVIEELGRVDTASLNREVAAKVTAGVKKLERIGAPRDQPIGADMFRYDIEVEDEGGHRKLTVTQEGDPGNPLPQPLDDLLSAIEGPR